MIQGCPLSGVVFAVAMDPFLACVADQLDGRNATCTRVSADDVATVAHEFKSLIPLEKISAASRRFQPSSFSQRNAS